MVKKKWGFCTFDKNNKIFYKKIRQILANSKFIRFFAPACLIKFNYPFYLFFIIIFMNIYIGNLNYSVRENDLKEVMEDYGTVVSVKIIKDRETGRSKGFAFCEIEEDDAAKKAIAELNGSEYAGRPMVVKEALPKN
jgi:RNA recognition motif-containing protein